MDDSAGKLSAWKLSAYMFNMRIYKQIFDILVISFLCVLSAKERIVVYFCSAGHYILYYT